MQDLSKYTVPTSFVGMSVPKTVVGMLVTLLSHACKGCGSAICHFLNIVQEYQNSALILRLVPLVQYSLVAPNCNDHLPLI